MGGNFPGGEEFSRGSLMGGNFLGVITARG